MATHDYVIDNSTGANVRSDINSVLQAILTNNSSSSAPSTTAAYMWWADTTNGVLKIRNSSDNGWVELLQLDGTLTLEDGSQTAPALAFRDDLNTGIFSSGADKFDITTGGVEKISISTGGMSINDTGADFDVRIEGDTEQNLVYINAGLERIGMKTSSPDALLHLKDTVSPARVHVECTAANSFPGLRLTNDARGYDIQIDGATDALRVHDVTASAERLRVDSSGRLLIGLTTSATTDSNVHQKLQIVTTAGPNVFLGRDDSDTADDSRLGTINFGANHGGTYHEIVTIRAAADAQHASNSKASRLELYTTASGNTQSQERVRIDKDGAFMVGTTQARTAEFTHPDGFSIRGDVAGQIQNTVTDNTCMLLNRDGTDGQVLGFRKDGSSIGEIGVTGGAIYLQFESTGTASHRLDDYEEGTFTPLLSDNISSGTANSYQNQSGHYTKIGNIVHIIGGIRADDISNLTSSNTLCLRGLPFAASDVTTGSGEPDMLHIPFMNNLTNVDRGLVYGRVENGVSAVNIGFPTTTVQSGGNLLISQINSSSATFFSFSATYRTGG